MMREWITINGTAVAHFVVPITGDGSCLFRAVSYHLYGNQCLGREVREDIVDHVAANWARYSFASYDARNGGDNYANAEEYRADMSLPHTYGGTCELQAAGELYPIFIEVFHQGNRIQVFGDSGNPVARLRFTGDLSNGHFDAYETVSITVEELNSSPCVLETLVSPSGTVCSEIIELTTQSTLSTIPDLKVHKAPKKRRARVINKTKRQVNQGSSAKYQRKNPDVHRAAVSKYTKNNPDVNRAAVSKYTNNNPDVHRAAVSKYTNNNPDVHRAAVSKYTTNNPHVNRAAVLKYQENNYDLHRQSVRTYEKTQNMSRTERRATVWKEKHLSGFQYDPAIDYENDKFVAIGDMTVKCRYCDSLKFKDEANGMCCNSGKVQLPTLHEPPEPLYSLLMDLHPDHKHFIERIRVYNGCFQMTSFGGKQVDQSGYMPTFKVQGQVYHLIGSLLPQPQQEPKFLQIYFTGEDDKETRIRCKNFPGTKEGLVKQLQTMLHQNNEYVKELKTAMQKVQPNCPNFKVVINADKKPIDAHRGRFNAPTSSEIALVIVGQQFEKRDIVLESHDNKLQRISEVHRAYDTLQYPLMFSYGEDGYSVDITQRDPVTKLPLKKTVSACDFYSNRIMIKEGHVNYLLYYRALLNQFVVDVYAKIETERLNFIRFNQSQLRAESYIHLKDAIGQNDTVLGDVGRVVMLPSSFTGSPRYMHEKMQDAMTYVRNYGSPDLFITFTCNPRWTEIAKVLLSGQKPTDRYDLIGRVFHIKVKKLMGLLTKGQIFGAVRCFMYSVEWQKRGLPHIHILLWMVERITPNQIDDIICAEIPDANTDPTLHDIVKSNMIHGPCGVLNNKSPCMINNSCSKRFPRPLINETITGDDGYPQYRRRAPGNGGYTTNINDTVIDNRWVVPYNPVLSRTFQAHINVEYCHSVKSIKYICKYVNKGSDQAAFGVENENDEVTTYECGRYISSAEAVWRILCFPIHERFPSISHLAVHLENGQRIYFNPNDKTNLVDTLNKPPHTTLLSFFELNKTDNFARSLLYVEVPSYYVFTKNKFIRRKRGADVEGWPGIKKDPALGRVYTVHPNNTECYHLRLLLHHVRGPTSFDHLKTINNVMHPTYQAACKALGLLDSDEHWEKTLEEAAVSHFANRLRELFAIMIVFCHMSDPLFLWNKFKEDFSEDLTRQVSSVINTSLTEDHMANIYNKCLILIEDSVLNLGGHSLSQYCLPSPDRTASSLIRNREFLQEMNYDTVALSTYVNNNVTLLTDDQKTIFESVVDSIDSGAGGIFFLDAPGGTGKTFLINLLLAKVRSTQSIALAVASSGIAATLLEGGKTAHTTFKLPLNLNIVEDPVCNISKQSNIAKVLKECKLIVWDECTMSHKRAFEAVNKTLKDVTGNSIVMGGVTFLLAGDFRQTLPVVNRGTRADEIRSCLKSSYLWPHIKKITLKKNMRVHLHGDVSAGLFSETLLSIGDGRYPVFEGKIELNSDVGKIVHSLAELVETVYPDIKNIKEKPMEWLCQRAILCPKNKAASEINDLILESFNAERIEYIAVDATVEQDHAVHYPVEFLNTLNPPGMPPYRLPLKVGAPVMLLRNLKPPNLCNGTRLQIKALHKNVVEATVITGCAKGESVFIPRIPLIPSDYPFEFKRIQFPLRVCFAMSINKAQGQSLKVAGVDLREPCFSHGQLYVACSRVSTASNLIILSPTGDTVNVVYRDVL